MEWLWNLMADHESVAYTVIVYSVVIAIGVALGKVKFLASHLVLLGYFSQALLWLKWVLR